MLLFGALGYLMRKFEYEPAPLVLAFVIGPMLEKAMRQSLIMSGGSVSIFFMRPISLVLMIMLLLIVLSHIATFVFKRDRVAPN